MNSNTSEKVDYDKEYSPSLNTKRFQEYDKPQDQVLINFVTVTEAETLKVREKYNTRLNVRYGGDNDRQLVDIYFKGQEPDTPIFVYIHGGYWQELDKTTAGSFVWPLVENGYRVVVMDYNLCPQVTLEQLTEQTCQFYEWLFQYAKETNADKISFCGHSAGAHLVTFLLTSIFPTISHTQHTTSFFLISGLYDLRDLWRLESANPRNILDLNAVKAEQLSPLYRSLENDLVDFCQRIKLKVHVLAAEYDSETFKRQSQDYAEKLKAADLSMNFRIFGQYDHFDIIEEAANENSAIARYILENLN